VYSVKEREMRLFFRQGDEGPVLLKSYLRTLEERKRRRKIKSP